MKPEARSYLDKAMTNLMRAPTFLAHGWTDEAARVAYFAAFHAAQALLFQRRDVVAKTHRGVQAGLVEETTHDPAWDRELRGFLSRGYLYKTIADYGTDPASSTTPEQANAAMLTAERFIAAVRQTLEQRER